jgi:hypothetical protein
MHLVTNDVIRECQEGLKGVEIGIFMLHCMHTSAGLTVSKRFLTSGGEGQSETDRGTRGTEGSS